MHEAEGVNFGVGVPSEDKVRPKNIRSHKGLRYSNPSLGDIIDFIEGLSLNKTDKDFLSSVARRVPHGALFNFRKNYMQHLQNKGRS